jgi:ribosomal protein S18 acetylase RimI-like enzyme
MLLYKEIEDYEIEESWKLIQKVYNKFIAPDYNDQGNKKYHELINIDFLKNREIDNRLCMICKQNNIIIGIIGIRNDFHITIFFVDPEFQNQGVGKRLIKLATEQFKEYNNKIGYLEVNSSPYAVEIYKKIGFRKISEEKNVFGIRFTEMRMDI